MRAYRSFCLWADGMQAGSSGSDKLIYLMGVIPMFAVPLIGEWWLIPASIFAFAWMAFLLWRFWVMARTGYVGGDLSVLREAEAIEKKRSSDPPTNGD
ncbi:hypothetical protein G4G27_14425 [Sphingomonas sp. So64.6b]|uniref:hypothetical protein n=1 Tax=Sphingomonas sp. So64.6b TaxID=2997354 RepID=UPI0015FFE65E|nr:hypothetical protein [Sphingomonas sp. So64.6b]QNA85058.1 hypothetical protein G4G27_14425 [Sphingomonas sp. So64.6b]